MTNLRKNAGKHTHGQLLKQIVAICFVIFFPIVSIADNITTSPANCNSTTLNTSTGPATLNADWQANDISITWYSDGAQITNDPNAATQCTYDETFVLPAPPARIGYNFTGWRVAKYDFASLYTTVHGSQRWMKGLVSNADNCRTATWEDSTMVTESCSLAVYNDLKRYAWKVLFDWGTIYGIGKCSVTDGGTEGTIGNPSDIASGHCWCKVTRYKPTGVDTIYIPDSDLPWKYYDLFGSKAACQAGCMQYCAKRIQMNQTFRRGAFGVQ